MTKALALSAVKQWSVVHQVLLYSSAMFLPFAVTLPLLLGSTLGYEYATKSFEVPVDHFSFSRNDTFQMKYLVNDSYWDPKGGPIFFYTGNEGSIEMFANNTGFMWEIAPSFKALIIFAEHRYYGTSLPFGEKSLSKPELSGYLTSQQALADYVDLIEYLKKNQSETEESPVIAFGGSYGGMLAAYIRMKYPHVVAGALAASAPIWQFPGMTPCELFYRITTKVYGKDVPSCPVLIRRSWGALKNVTSTDEGRTWFSKEWKLCKPMTSQDSEKFRDWLQDVYVNLAMANYPYPANFLADLPGYPILAFCQHLRNENLVGKTLLTALFRSVSVYFNYTGEAKCLDWQKGTASLGDDGWDYQSCTEMVMPMCSDGENDMFEASPWDFNKFSNECYAKWKVHPRPHLAEKIYGGERIEYASNIIFSNGLLDPWSSGRVRYTSSPTLILIIIPDGAHHLDLRASNAGDPGSVQKARSLYKKYIDKWIRGFKEETQTPLFSIAE